MLTVVNKRGARAPLDIVLKYRVKFIYQVTFNGGLTKPPPCLYHYPCRDSTKEGVVSASKVAKILTSYYRGRRGLTRLSYTLGIIGVTAIVIILSVMDMLWLLFVPALFILAMFIVRPAG